MIISDLNCLEVLSDATNIEGGSYKKRYFYFSSASAYSDANALAIGGKVNLAYTSTYNSTLAAPGVAASYSSGASSSTSF